VLPGIFISYRRSDSPDATGRIYDGLVSEFGKAQVFKDVDSPDGRFLIETLDTALNGPVPPITLIQNWNPDATRQ
jgi:hypothetical protein